MLKNFKQNTIIDTLTIENLRFEIFFFKNFVKNLFDARGLCVRARAYKKITRALTYITRCIALICVPRDNLARARPTCGSQPVNLLNTPT